MRWLLIAVLVVYLTACGGETGAPTPPSTVYIVVGGGDEAFYLSSPDLDPSSWPDDSSSHKVSAVPNGSVTVCKFTLSQGVHLIVWSTGSQASTDLARAYCQREGQ